MLCFVRTGYVNRKGEGKIWRGYDDANETLFFFGILGSVGNLLGHLGRALEGKTFSHEQGMDIQVERNPHNRKDK